MHAEYDVREDLVDNCVKPDAGKQRALVAAHQRKRLQNPTGTVSQLRLGLPCCVAERRNPLSNATTLPANAPRAAITKASAVSAGSMDSVLFFIIGTVLL